MLERKLKSVVVALALSLLLAGSGHAAVSSSGRVLSLLTTTAKGDGIADDTIPVQRALTACSMSGATCVVPRGKSFLITQPLFMWGNAKLIGEDESSLIIFKTTSAPYLLNLGISGRKRLAAPFAGTISGVTFRVAAGKGGRVLFFWRTNSAHIVDNVFDVGRFPYSATSSGNDNNWVVNGFGNCIRKNIEISRNKIIGKSDEFGSEGIGLGNFDGAVIEGNSIEAVGDDPVGIHFSQNVRIANNSISSVDGRIFVANSQNVEIANNSVTRVASRLDGRFRRGIALIYIGFETLGTNSELAPENVYVHNNTLTYEAGAIDKGAAIYLYAPRRARVEFNTVINDSSGVGASGLHLLPAAFVGQWHDPTSQDMHNVAKPRDIQIKNNKFEGRFPQAVIMTGNCVDYAGPVGISDNAAARFRLYCPFVNSARNVSAVR